MCQTPNPWEPKKANETYHYKGQPFTLSDIQYSVCRKCEFEVVLPQQTRRNEARVRDEHRRIDGLLTGQEIKAIRKRLCLSQAQAAELMGGGANAFSKYERGEVMQSVAMNQLLLVLAAMPEAYEILSGHKNEGLLGKKQISPEITIQVSNGTETSPILNCVRRVSVEQVRDYKAELLAA